MKNASTTVLVFILALGLGGLAPAQQAAHKHEHQDMHAGGDLELQRPETGKWASDEALRQGMSDLKAAFDPAHEAYREDAFDADEAVALADRVEGAVNFMFANCQLPAEADAELHKLLAASLQAAQTLRESDDPHRGLHSLHQVLKTYPEYFDHPGWSDLDSSDTGG